MTFRETREQFDKLLEEAETLKSGPTPEKIRGMIDDLKPMLAKLVEMSDPDNEVHARVCRNREINISTLETALAKVKGKAIKSAIKKKKEPVVLEKPTE